MNRRDFMGLSLAAAGMVFAPKFGRWHRQGSGLLIPDGHYATLYEDDSPFAVIPIIEGEGTSLRIRGDHMFRITETYQIPRGLRNHFPSLPATVPGLREHMVRIVDGTLTIEAPTPLLRYV